MDPLVRFIAFVGFFVAIVFVIHGVKWLRRKNALRITTRNE